MKLLYILPETIHSSGGGIATYHKHARMALEDAGHETFLLTWRIARKSFQEVTLLDDRSACINIQEKQLDARFGRFPRNAAVGHFLAPYINRFIEEWNPDLLETSDYLAPLYGYLAMRRAGLLRSQHRRPVVAFNHGLEREILRADARLPTIAERQESVVERTALRWTDRVLVPSRAAMTKLERQMGELGHSMFLPEPYYPELATPAAALPADRFVHLGRVDFAKGIDNIAHIINILHSLTRVEEILMIGRIAASAFRTRGADEYFLRRLPQELRARVRFSGRISPDERNATLNPGGGGGYSLNFSNQETYNYAFLEMIDAGLVPLTMADTAMAEFMPAEHRGTLIPQAMEIGTVRKALETIRARPSEYVESIREHAFAMASPKAFAERYEQLASDLCVRPKKTVRPVVKRILTSQDVTVLMASYNPGPTIRDSVASVLAQTMVPNVIIHDDGSSDAGGIERLREAERMGENITIHRSPANEGLCATRRKLVAACTTEFAIFMDDDDLLDPQYVEKTLTAMNENTVGADAIVTLRENFDQSREKVLKYNLEDHELFLSNDYRMTALIRTSVLRDLDFSPTLRNGEADDWDFWLRFREKGYRIVLLPEPLFKYRFRRGSMSWPWSQGQTALTAELTARAALQAVRDRTAPDDLLLDLYCDMLGSGHASERVFMKNVRQARPILGSILYFFYKTAYSLAKRL